MRQSLRRSQCAGRAVRDEAAAAAGAHARLLSSLRLLARQVDETARCPRRTRRFGRLSDLQSTYTQTYRSERERERHEVWLHEGSIAGYERLHEAKAREMNRLESGGGLN